MMLGRTAEATMRVFPPATAEALLGLRDQDVPAGSNSSRLADVMEQAAVRLMRRGIDRGQSTVAVSNTLHHASLAPARGDTLHARATCLSIEGRFYRFEVNVFDESGLVASGEHVRAVVSPRREQAGARLRASIEAARGLSAQPASNT